jgi:hypothetical protein
LIVRLVILAAAILTWNVDVFARAALVPAAIVRDVLSAPDDRLDYGRAKLAFDQIVDPSLNAEATLAEIGRLARAAEALAGVGASPAAKLSALRRVIYESGEWNGGIRSVTIMPIHSAGMSATS